MASQDWFEKDFYAVLGVSKDVSNEELKKTYRKLARQYHPDSTAGDAKAEAKFKEISEAYAVLSDPEQRAEYDQVRAMGGGARFTGTGAGGFEDVFSNLFGGGGSRVRFGTGGAGFEDIFGGFGGYPSGPTKGRDVVASATIGFEQAITGDTVKLRAADGRTITVKVPAGVKDGQKIKLRGKGQPSPDGGEAGDMVITVAVRPHPIFTRDGNNLRVDVPVTFVEAALGATIEVPLLGSGSVKLKIAPGTPSGRVLRVKGKGIASDKGKGDLLVTVQVVVPSELNDEAKAAIEALAAALPDTDPRAELRAKAQG